MTFTMILIVANLVGVYLARRRGLTYRDWWVRMHVAFIALLLVLLIAEVAVWDPSKPNDRASVGAEDDRGFEGAETTTTAAPATTEPVIVGEVGEVTNPHALLEPVVIGPWFVKADAADANAADALAKEVPGIPAPANGRYVVVTFQVAATERSGVPAPPSDALDVAITDALGKPIAPCPFELPGPSLSAPLPRTRDVVGVRACADATPEQAAGARFAVTLRPSADDPSGHATVYWATA